MSKIQKENLFFFLFSNASDFSEAKVTLFMPPNTLFRFAKAFFASFSVTSQQTSERKAKENGVHDYIFFQKVVIYK